MNMSSKVWMVASMASLLPMLAVGVEEGAEFGARLSVARQNPLEATVTFTPTLDIRSVVVEVPNDAGGSRGQCNFPLVSAGKTYTCQVVGGANDQTNGLVVALVGSLGSGANAILVRKAFTVTNPGYNAAKTRAAERAALGAKGRLQQREAVRN